MSDSTKACEHVLIAFGLERKTETEINLAAAAGAVAAGQFLWLDLLALDTERAHALLASLNLFSDLVIDDALGDEETTFCPPSTVAYSARAMQHPCASRQMGAAPDPVE